MITAAKNAIMTGHLKQEILMADQIDALIRNYYKNIEANNASTTQATKVQISQSAKVKQPQPQNDNNKPPKNKSA